MESRPLIATVMTVILVMVAFNIRSVQRETIRETASSVFRLCDGDDQNNYNETTQQTQHSVQQQPPRFNLPPGIPAKDPSYFPFWLIVSRKKKLAVTIVPKVMCTSLRDAFNRVECSTESPEDVPQGEIPRCAEARRKKPLGKMSLDDDTGFIRAIFIRDPFERALSAYNNSNTNKFIRLRRCQNASMCTFSEWVHELTGKYKRSFFGNEHFKTQTDIGQFDKFHYHYVFRISSAIDQDFFWSKLMNQTAFSSNTSNNNNKTRSIVTSKRKEKEDEFNRIDPAIFTRLKDMYADDLILWEQVLQRGTPRQEDEFTLYDIYKEKAKNASII